jgi:uncharacterized protein (DUF2252 family)
MGVLDVWSLFAYAERRPASVKVPRKAWAIVQKTVAKAKRTTNETLLKKIAHRGHDGGWRFQEDPPILTRVDDETRRRVVESLKEYADHLSPAYRFMLGRYAVADVAHRVVGVGSVGTRAYLALCFGNGDDDPLFLQVKEAIAPAHAPYLPRMVLREDHQGNRVVTMQRVLQALGDPLLGRTTIDGRPFFVRDRVRGPAGARPRAVRRCSPHRRLLRRHGHPRPRSGRVRRPLRRPDRTGPCRTRQGDQGWTSRSRRGGRRRMTPGDIERLK